MTQLGFIRSLARYFLDTKVTSQYDPRSDSFTKEHTIDELYQLVYPNFNKDEINLYSYPLKSILDDIQMANALVDLKPATKTLPSAHFDDESFAQSNQRIMELRQKVIEETKISGSDYKKAHEKLGELLHTLQDFYSHSNWIEMGETKINSRIGIEENIGNIAAPDQATCKNNGCDKIQSKCSILQKFILKNCPMEYFECRSNILKEINEQKLLTSGYVAGRGEPSTKPVNVEKCSHGSVMDATSYQPPVGGINKDTMTPIYSPHYYLHFEAVKLAVEATERFFNELRTDIGNEKFDRLFSISPTEEELKRAREAIKYRKKFHFVTSTLSIGLTTSDINFQKTLKERIEEILSILFDWTSSDSPTYSVDDQQTTDEKTNIHGSSMILDVFDSSNRKRRRHFRHRSFRKGLK